MLNNNSMNVNIVSEDDVDKTTNMELYKYLIDGEDKKVFEICKGLPNGPLHVVTIHGDTVLHMAGFNKRNNLVVALLRSLHESQFEKLTWVNSSGNTMLHSTATNNKTLEAAKEMLLRAPSLLWKPNKLGETALFRAVRYGKSDIFHFLSDRVLERGEGVELFLRRSDKSTILHEAILSHNFDLAISITRLFPKLIVEEDGDGLTALQLLSLNPSAFDNGVGDSFLKKLIYDYVDCTPKDTKERSKIPLIKEMRIRKHKYESAIKLVKILVEIDKSWKDTVSRLDLSKPRFHKYTGNASLPETKGLGSILDTPLLLATKGGCTEIVKEILNVYPQAVEHIDGDGRNILHVAIKYRRADIINIVINMAHSIRRLSGKIDKEGHSLLHMFSVPAKDTKAKEDVRNPALIMRDDLILFEKMKNICTTLTRLQVNFNGETAEQMLLEKTTQLRADAKEWMKNTAENCSIVAVLIATVAFAAAYTVPGGPNQATGYPLLKNKPFFIVFALADALSLTFSLTSVIVFLSILTSSFRLNDFRYSLHNKLLLGITLLILSVSMMMIAFAATLILTISSGQSWTNVFLYIISFFPVTVYAYSYVHLYKLLINAFCEKVWMLKEALFPRVNVAPPQADFTRTGSIL